jgi:hypothetical protein
MQKIGCRKCKVRSRDMLGELYSKKGYVSYACAPDEKRNIAPLVDSSGRTAPFTGSHAQHLTAVTWT